MVIAVSISMIPPASRLRLAVLPMGIALAAWSWFIFPRPGPPGAQNQILVGLTLALLTLVPTEPRCPPERWRGYLSRRETTGPQTAKG